MGGKIILALTGKKTLMGEDKDIYGDRVINELVDRTLGHTRETEFLYGGGKKENKERLSGFMPETEY